MQIVPEPQLNPNGHFVGGWAAGAGAGAGAADPAVADGAAGEAAAACGWAPGLIQQACT